MMTTIFKPLPPESSDALLLHEMHKPSFLEGECYAFAIALHQGLDWPLVGLIKPYDATMDKHNVIWHAGVQNPNGNLYDVRGELSAEDFADHFDIDPEHIKAVTNYELLNTRPVHPHTIALARKLAEIWWPDLPWINSRREQLTTFADELEALCRKHQLWIGSNVAMCTPLLFPGHDDEGGYEVTITDDGMGCTINRYL